MFIAYLGLGVAILIILLGFIFPEKICEMSARFWEKQIRLLGFEADIRSTPRTTKIFRIWNLIGVFIVILGLILMFCFRKM